MVIYRIISCQDVCQWRTFDMVFIETPVFTRCLKELLDDESYGQLQKLLSEAPDTGDLIPGTSGLRKIRVAAKGHGKSGGARVIYYHFSVASHVAMLLIYPKNEQDDLTHDQRRILRSVIEHWR